MYCSMPAATHAIPLWLYIHAGSDKEAHAIKQKVAALLRNPMLKMALQDIPEMGFNVAEPQRIP